MINKSMLILFLHFINVAMQMFFVVETRKLDDIFVVIDVCVQYKKQQVHIPWVKVGACCIFWPELVGKTAKYTMKTE